MHLLKVKFAKLEMGDRRLVAGRGTGTVEFLERTIGVVPDMIFSGHWGTPLSTRGGTLQPGEVKLTHYRGKRKDVDQL